MATNSPERLAAVMMHTWSDDVEANCRKEARLNNTDALDGSNLRGVLYNFSPVLQYQSRKWHQEAAMLVLTVISPRQQLYAS